MAKPNPIYFSSSIMLNNERVGSANAAAMFAPGVCAEGFEMLFNSMAGQARKDRSLSACCRSLRIPRRAVL
jgi:hypothetical protein